MIGYYTQIAMEAYAEFLDKLILGIYQPIFSPFQLESYYVHSK